MKKIAHIIVLSLLILGYGCGQKQAEQTEGYGAGKSTMEDDNQTGAGQIDDSERDRSASDEGNTMQDVTTRDSMHTLERVGETEATRATEITQEAVGNSQTRGDENHSKSRTTENKKVPKQ